MLSSFQSSGLSLDHSNSRMISKKQEISFIPLLGSDPLSSSSSEIMSLPMNPYVGDNEIKYISKRITI